MCIPITLDITLYDIENLQQLTGEKGFSGEFARKILSTIVREIDVREITHQAILALIEEDR